MRPDPLAAPVPAQGLLNLILLLLGELGLEFSILRRTVTTTKCQPAGLRIMRLA